MKEREKERKILWIGRNKLKCKLTFGCAQKDLGGSAESDDVVGPQLDAINRVRFEVLHFKTNVGRVRYLSADQLASFDQSGRSVAHLLKRKKKIKENN
jgi:hypothetical protein